MIKKDFFNIAFVGIFILAGVFLSVVPNQHRAQALTASERAALESQLEQLEAEIARQEKILSQQKNQSASISNEISKLRAQVDTARSKINYRNTQIRKLSSEITDKDRTVRTLEVEITEKKDSIAELIRETRELDDRGVLHVVLAADRLSDFYKDADSFVFLRKSLKDSMDELRGIKTLTEEEKKNLEAKKGEEEVARLELERQKKLVEESKAEQDALLTESKNQEKVYESLIARREAEAAEIRATLIEFQGSGIQNKSISFGEAYDYAKNTERKTGVSAAFIMAIMQQETSFGNNVGGCYVTKKPTGAVNGVFPVDGIYIKSGKPSRKNMIPSNFDAFKRITSALGFDWSKTPISCALITSTGSLYGYGGAMGYTQFIPNTWESVAKRVESYLGVNVANPWNPEHAVMATGVFLRDLGATAKTFESEREAACKYYSGRSCYAPNVSNMWYGNQVMAKKSKIQAQIDILER